MVYITYPSEISEKVTWAATWKQICYHLVLHKVVKRLIVV